MTENEVLETLVTAIRERRLVQFKIDGRLITALPCAVGALPSGQRAAWIYQRSRRQKRPTGDEWRLIELSHIASAVPSPFGREPIPLEWEWPANVFQTIYARL